MKTRAIHFRYRILICVMASASTLLIDHVVHAQETQVPETRTPETRTDTLDSVKIIRRSRPEAAAKTQPGVVDSIVGAAIKPYAWYTRDVKGEVIKTLGEKGLARLFSQQERERIGQELEKEFEKLARPDGEYLPKEPDIVNALNAVTTKLVETISVRVLEKNDLGDAESGKTWAKKILEPFQQCMTNASNYGSATSCRETLSADLPANLGLMGMHEALKKDLGPEYVQKYTNAYSDCASAPARSIEACALKTFREAAVEKGKTDIQAEQKRIIPDSSIDVASKFTPSFAQCLEDKKTKVEIQACARELREKAGQEIVRLRVLEDPNVRKYVANQADREKLAKVAQSEYASCLNENRSADMRSSSASADLCQVRVKKTLGNGMAKILFPERIKKFVAESGGAGKLKMTDAEVEALSDRTISANEACINQLEVTEDVDQGLMSCMQSGANTLTKELGAKNLEAELFTSLKADTDEAEVARKALHEKLDGDFKECVSGAKGDDDRQACVDSIRRNANLEIGKRAVRDEVWEQLRLKDPPQEILNSEKILSECLQASKDPSLCSREHAIRSAKFIGSIKLRYGLGKLIGTKGLKSNAEDIKSIESSYFDCLDKIVNEADTEVFRMALNSCSDHLRSEAVAYTEQESLEELVKKGDSKQVREIKEKVVESLPCLMNLIPETPIHPNALSRLNPDGLMKALVGQINDFIAYDPKKAGKALESVLAELNKGENNSPEAKRRLIAKLSEEGVIDQIIKSVVYNEMKTTFEKMNRRDRPSPAIMKRLLAKENFDKIFNPKVMKGLRPLIATKILSPVLVDGVAFNSKQILAAQGEIKRRISETLVHSPHFGTVLASSAVQGELNKTDGMTRFFATLMYGNRALDWSHVRHSQSGQRAESYIKEQIIRPKILGQRITVAEEGRRKQKAMELVKAAVQRM